MRPLTPLALAVMGPVLISHPCLHPASTTECQRVQLHRGSNGGGNCEADWAGFPEKAVGRRLTGLPRGKGNMACCWLVHSTRVVPSRVLCMIGTE